MGETRVRKLSIGVPLALGLVCVLAPGAAPPLEACSCSWSPVNHPCVSYSERSVVFLGRAIEERTVEDGRSGWYRRVTTFTVEESFHGVIGTTVEIATGMGPGSCGPRFEMGLPVFVRARRTESSEELQVSPCRTYSPLELSSSDIDYGRAVAAGDPGIAIFGRVAAAPPGGEAPAIDGEAMEGVAVSVHGDNGHSLWATTDSEGRFEIPGPLNGRYTVRADIPGASDPSLEQEVEVVDGEQCQLVEFSFSGPGS